ncbi:MAG TPA: UDP-N-acetylmuramate--L-alanine ligase [Gammaproteobacteria bacterium]|jgi:UDP-N-acetylmuramate--alanine ligase|nr:UDP-N-acetylmuramate--L-alanine ligase [Gammaproteobacteria bacterium]
MKNPHSITKSRIQNIHFIGIGGSGMSGIAEVLNNLGYNITGSDISNNKATAKLERMGCKISYEHLATNVEGSQAVVVSSAIDENNPEIIKARKLNIPIVPRAEMLADLMRFRFGIAIAGTHGKTTTTSMIAHILSVARLDPTYIIGGILNSSGSNAMLGEGDYLIAEADESDASFLHLQPILSVITNIDQDHMQTYGNVYKKLKDAFISFASNLPFYGTCIMCIDDKGVKQVIKSIHRPVVTYGFSDGADIQATNVSQKNMQMYFEVKSTKYDKFFSVKLNQIGNHNILNTLAAIGICFEIGIDTKLIQRAIGTFSGVARRLDYHGKININNNKLSLFDDYGHHPNEIAEVFKSLNNTYPDKRLVVIFQPHRYTRTRDLFDDFSYALTKVDALILLDIYSANEKPIAHINSRSLANSIRQRSSLSPIVIKDPKEIFTVLPNIVNDGDMLLTLGAGDIHTIPELLIEKYANK